MKIIARPLGTGKTKELMDAALEADGIILTTNKRAVHKLEDVMEEYFRMEFGLELAGFSVRMEE